MDESISFITLVVIIVVGLILWIYNQRQASALKAMARATEDTYMIALKNRRDAHKQAEFKTAPMDWLKEQAGIDYSLLGVASNSAKPAWINLRCDNGYRMVVSPLAPAELKAVLKAKQKASKLGEVEEPLLGTSAKHLSVKEVSLRDNEWFDLEADKVGKALGVGWGEVSRLYFYEVAKKEK